MERAIDAAAQKGLNRRSGAGDWQRGRPAWVTGDGQAQIQLGAVRSGREDHRDRLAGRERDDGAILARSVFPHEAGEIGLGVQRDHGMVPHPGSVGDPLPSVGDEVQADGLSLRVLSMSGRRIRRLRITREHAEEAEGVAAH